MEVSEVPRFWFYEPEKLVMAVAFFFEVRDERTGAEVFLGADEGLDQRGAASWAYPRRSAVGDEHVGGSNLRFV